MNHTSPNHRVIRVSCIEDESDYADFLRGAIASDPALHLDRIYETAEAAFEGLPRALRAPDVMLVDVRLPDQSGIDAVPTLRQLVPQTQLMMLTKFADPETLFAALKAGAVGYLLKEASAADLSQAIRELCTGGSPMSPAIARKLVSHFHLPRAEPAPSPLTPQQSAALRMLASGKSYKQIADALGISVNTLKSHLQAVYKKLQVASRTEAVVKYLKNNQSNGGH